LSGLSVSVKSSFLKHRKKIDAIKEFCSSTGSGLRDAKEFIDKFGSGPQAAIQFLQTFQ
jgi:ribosomal protein L7/L12